MECCEGLGDMADYMSTVGVFQSDPTPIYTTPGYTPGYNPYGGSGASPWDAISTAIKSASGILGTRY